MICRRQEVSKRSMKSSCLWQIITNKQERFCAYSLMCRRQEDFCAFEIFDFIANYAYAMIKAKASSLPKAKQTMPKAKVMNQQAHGMKSSISNTEGKFILRPMLHRRQSSIKLNLDFIIKPPLSSLLKSKISNSKGE